ncbi:ArsR family transcriptional regulator [Alicyclobacillus sacchari]|uniref:ArsR family transcriptional regulator n=1 Tax=Alicyclobacillus sacchari TaxID=392010 RepID=A0A4R8LTY4_9BACL|nr:metalloregulator ArsR/SmtB family transcription factor [Alicyclobacillus sacchari]TDY51200.1 ArsR family transcriptional regulator [Alicyclobacillus sacchari]
MDFDSFANTLKALADPTRLRMIALLNVRERCVCELVPLFGISQPAISKHLSRLKAVGLVQETRRGMWVFYSLNKARLVEVGISLHQLSEMTRELDDLPHPRFSVDCEGVAT